MTTMTMTMPALTGSPRQIAWAEDLRQIHLDYIDRIIEHRRDEGLPPSQWLTAVGLGTVEALEDHKAYLLTFTAATWWIDRRFYDKPGFLEKTALIRQGIGSWPSRMRR